MDKEDLKELVKIRHQMMDLLQNAQDLLRQNAPGITYERAKSYWIGHIDVALGCGDYVDTHDQTFEKTLRELGWKGEDGDESTYDDFEEEGEDEEEDRLEND